MTIAIADTNILIELYRDNSVAKEWFDAQPKLSIASITWFELMEGSQGKKGQARNLQIISQFEVEYLTDADQRWAMNQLLKYQLSHGVAFKDCLIASVPHRLQIPLYTKNVKDFLPLLSSSLVIKPY